jgi:hypothetical protein
MAETTSPEEFLYVKYESRAVPWEGFPCIAVLSRRRNLFTVHYLT